MLGSEGDPLVKAAEEELEIRKKESAAAKQARREEAAQARLRASNAEGIEQPEGGDLIKKEKKKKKKRSKIEATILDSSKPFVPHEKRISVLLGRSDPVPA